MPEGAFDPWCALGVGVEWFSFSDGVLIASGTSPSSGLMQVMATNSVFGPFASVQADLGMRFDKFQLGPSSRSPLAIT